MYRIVLAPSCSSWFDLDAARWGSQVGGGATVNDVLLGALAGMFRR